MYRVEILRKTSTHDHSLWQNSFQYNQHSLIQINLITVCVPA